MIELAKVSLQRGGAAILESAFVCIEASQVVLISGPSGIGKTSLLSLIGGFLTADEGEVRVFGHDVARMRSTSTALLRRRLAFVPQELELIGDFSALANVRLALEVCGTSRREAKRRASEALDAVDLAAQKKRRVTELSTGQRRRVSLARGLVRNAQIFVADEPSNDLDAERVLQLVQLIEDMREAGCAVVIATNDPRFLAHAQQPGWRHLTLSCAQLIPGDMTSLFNNRPTAAPASDIAVVDKVVPFPVSASGD
ncbi:MAG: ATP-binding cassette domain-containing protein [Myxococcales bacterium]|nr:ATP-binding cassette domain-containing protein [Myxococcales bacterium]